MAEDTKKVEEEKSSDERVRAGLSEAEMRANVVRLAFGNDARRLDEFVAVIGAAVPNNTAVVLRGSSVTGTRWEDGAPFDADGPGTSDIDLTLVGGDILDFFLPHGFCITGIHTKPLSEKDPDIAPMLIELRRELTAMAGRPVNIQGTRDWIMFVREYLMGQPYLTILGRLEEA
jgi:hypothetical protein